MIGAFSHRCNSRHRLAESVRRCASPKAITWSTHSRRIDPINLSAKPFCQGEPGAMGLSRMPMARNRCMTADAPILGCADPTRCRGHWPHTQPPRPGRIASSICADLICDRDRHSALYTSNRGTHSSMISECFHGVSFMKSRRHFPVMLGEYWIYVLAVVISITTLMLLYSHNGPIGLPRWW
jgi:hypothetical protein